MSVVLCLAFLFLSLFAKIYYPSFSAVMTLDLRGPDLIFENIEEFEYSLDANNTVGETLNLTISAFTNASSTGMKPAIVQKR